MSLLTFFSFIVYSTVTSITPGPNNIMLAASGLNFGLKRSIPHILGIGFGFGVMVILVGYGIGAALGSSPLLYEILKIIGISYLLYLAYKIYRAGSIKTDTKVDKPLSFMGAALFQWVNPKAWIMAMGAITTYSSANSRLVEFVFIGVIFGLVSIPSVGVWAYMGEKLKMIVNHPRKVQLFNTVMALLLVASVIVPIKDSVKFFIP
ncbi:MULTISPECIES: LysE family translocator [Acinetobacter]|uniref:Translocator protein, LysE family n=1 Tax=Acinetobacter haemolyticus ATCC 19194 TaxID=707232 RepID=D4XPQ4_ACIHA|nr:MULTISPECIES: LysE family translocator [Acinetobacter]AZN69348.1 LysE family translocator [Acinetobacter haemolyticus]EFF82831.1 translocator protein, LysE family [Acinetobacter haemolyticus ATCC 19194]MCU4378966.1 LysE family translocator [Acinetobacter haemolyticus]MCU4386770.1 LysE family translocator [Acinetobacter haemolyticus]MQZ31897.1 LysE family translocator [Acinetobacter haemolyticus]